MVFESYSHEELLNELDLNVVPCREILFLIAVSVSLQSVCIKDIKPNLHNCELIQDLKASFKCKADVYLSLEPSDCAGV